MKGEHMANENQRMAQIMAAILAGAGESSLSPGAYGWLFSRYKKWLTSTMHAGQTPADAWDTWGEAFLGQFTAIGAAAALSSGGEIDQNKAVTAATSVETSAMSPCPFCPPPDWS
jgi:hypothetical protein